MLIPANSRKSNKVLLVDSEPETALCLQGKLRSAGYEVKVLPPDSSRIRKTPNKLADVVVVDLPPTQQKSQSSEMLLSRLRTLNVPIVILDNSELPQGPRPRHRAHPRPVFVSKPYSYADLLAIIARLLANESMPASA